jgi:hypothetical protein
VRHFPEAASAFSDDSVPASSSPRIDAYDLHVETLGARSDDPPHRLQPRLAGTRTRIIERDVAPGIHRIEDAYTNWHLLEDDGALTVADCGGPS